jgi:hypothetical protein
MRNRGKDEMYRASIQRNVEGGLEVFSATACFIGKIWRDIQ